MKQKFMLFFVFSFCLFTSKFLHAQDGTLDKSFGTGGVVQPIFLRDTSETDASEIFLATLPGNKILLSNHSYSSQFNDSVSHCYLSVFTKEGNIDSSFGINGYAKITGGTDSDVIWGLTVQHDSKILVMLYRPYNIGVRILRYLLDGSIDSSFGKNGILSITGPDGNFHPLKNSVVITPDGKILLGGLYININNRPCTFISRYTLDGVIDLTFANNGSFLYSPPGQIGGIFGNVMDMAQHQIALQPDGKIIFSSAYCGGILRLNADGSSDSSFNDKKMIIPEQVSNAWGEIFYDFNVAQDGSFICAAALDEHDEYAEVAPCRLRINRYNKDGVIDVSLGEKGYLSVYQTDGLYANIQGLCVQRDKSFFFTYSGDEESYLKIKRYNEDGSRDYSFGVNGFLEDAAPGKTKQYSDMILLDDEKIVTAYVHHPGYNEAAIGFLARYNNISVLPITLTSFAATKKQNTSLLQWHTCSETNCKGFSMERSTDNKNFSSIGFAPSKGGGATCNNDYSFIDNTPANGINYYRLKILDNDGKFTYSNVDNLSFIISSLIKISPNPVTDILKVEGFNPMQNYELRIMNGEGKVVATATTNDDVYYWNISSLKNGVYYLVATNESGEKQTVKFIKQ